MLLSVLVEPEASNSLESCGLFDELISMLIQKKTCVCRTVNSFNNILRVVHVVSPVRTRVTGLKV